MAGLQTVIRFTALKCSEAVQLCAGHPPGHRNGNYSSGDNVAVFVSHPLLPAPTPERRRQGNYWSHYSVNDISGHFVSLINIASEGLIIG